MGSNHNRTDWLVGDDLILLIGCLRERTVRFLGCLAGQIGRLICWTCLLDGIRVSCSSFGDFGGQGLMG